MPPDLTGKRVLVTGGSRGIGRAIAVGLAKAGAHVAIVYRQDKAQAERTRDEIAALGVQALAVQSDTGDESRVHALIQTVTDGLGGIDVLVNNAGTQKRIPFRSCRSRNGGASCAPTSTGTSWSARRWPGTWWRATTPV